MNKSAVAKSAQRATTGLHKLLAWFTGTNTPGRTLAGLTGQRSGTEGIPGVDELEALMRRGESGRTTLDFVISKHEADLHTMRRVLQRKLAAQGIGTTNEHRN